MVFLMVLISVWRRCLAGFSRHLIIFPSVVFPSIVFPPIVFPSIIFLSIICIAPLTSQHRVAADEIYLNDWENYATMAEQGAVCGAFANIMELQSMVDIHLGKLWGERRKFAGSVVMEAARLEGLDSVAEQDVDNLLDQYSIWLLNTLANPARRSSINPEAYKAAKNMVGDVCTDLYKTADKAIFEEFPALAILRPSEKNNGEENLQYLEAENNELREEIANLQREFEDVSEALAAAPTDQQIEAVRENFLAAEDEILALNTANLLLLNKLNQLKKLNQLNGELSSPPSAPRQPTPAPPAQKSSEGGEHMTAQMPTQPNETDISTPFAQGATIGFIAQIGTYKSRRSAMAEINLLQQTFPDDLGNAGLTIRPADKGGIGGFRILTAAMSAMKAASICDALWNRMVGCMLKAVP